jgi:uncharacterized protein YukE
LALLIRGLQALAATAEQGKSSMSQAIVDPGELRRFAQNLKRFNNDLQNQMAALHGQLTGLSQTWRDQEQIKFTEQFEQTMQVMRRFMEASNQHVPFLLRKADRVEEYLQQR